MINFNKYIEVESHFVIESQMNRRFTRKIAFYDRITHTVTTHTHYTHHIISIRPGKWLMNKIFMAEKILKAFS